ncbi:MAG: PH domain-containing protein [Anaerolineae bacterium]|nr:PH domain-containing protein [Anaerolineae bacterium]
MTSSYLENLLGENEHIILITRQHWLVLLGRILAQGVLALGMGILITLIWRIWLPLSLVPMAYLLLILPLLGMLRNVTIWKSRQYVITNWRVIQMSGVFSKEVTDSALEKINDVKLEQSFWGRLLDYGDLEILTASELGVDRFTQIRQPIHLKTAMLNAKERLEHGQAGSGLRSEEDIAGLIEQLDSLRDQGLLTEAEFQQQKAQALAKLQNANQSHDSKHP